VLTPKLSFILLHIKQKLLKFNPLKKNSDTTGFPQKKAFTFKKKHSDTTGLPALQVSDYLPYKYRITRSPNE